MVEDPDASPATPVVHWLVWNVPPAVTSIPAGSAAGSVTGAVEGSNVHGDVGYYGPRPPPGDKPHHYHVEVFALDRALSLPSGADRDALGVAIEGHVLAAGEVIGTFERK